MFVVFRDALHQIWRAYEKGDVAEAVRLFRFQADHGVSGLLSPALEFRKGKPTLTLPLRSLHDFMFMETALVIAGGSQVMRCAECGTVFVTGSGTGRRGTSLYCYNRCRVAAQRSRKSTPASEVAMGDEEKLKKLAAGVRGPARE